MSKEGNESDNGIPLSLWLDMEYGKIGTPERDVFEHELVRDIVLEDKYVSLN